MAEICAAYPSAGSVYHWAGQVVPIYWAPLAAYVCGWANFLGNAAGDASFAYSWALFMDAARLSSVLHTHQSLNIHAIVSISILVLWVWTALNLLRIDKVGFVNNFAAFLQIGSILFIIIAIIVRAPSHRSAEFVFTDYWNDTGFSARSYVGAISLLSALWSFSGYEASAHMAEETANARKNAPAGILYTCLATGLGGATLLAALLFCTRDIDAILNDDDDSTYIAGGIDGNMTFNSTTIPGGFPYLGSVAAFNVFIDSAGVKLGSGLCWLVVIVTFFAGLSR